jgi:hypothetical protein
VVTNTGKVLNTAATNHDDGVLLEVMTDTGDISGDFIAVGKTNTSNLTQSGVRLLRSSGTNCSANATLLGRSQIGFLVLQSVSALLECGGVGLINGSLTALTNQLVKSRHE